MGLIGGQCGVEIRENAEVIGNIVKGFDWIRHHEVLVGITQEKSSRSNGQLTNAELMYIHTNGSPVNHIPPRPVIEPAISEEETFKRICDEIKNGMQSAFAGNLAGAERFYAKAGVIGMRAAQDYFTSGNLAPNAPITINGGWMRNHVSGKPVLIGHIDPETGKIIGKGSSRPLIDKGSLRKAITYVVRKV